MCGIYTVSVDVRVGKISFGVFRIRLGLWLTIFVRWAALAASIGVKLQIFIAAQSRSNTRQRWFNVRAWLRIRFWRRRILRCFSFRRRTRTGLFRTITQFFRSTVRLLQLFNVYNCAVAWDCAYIGSMGRRRWRCRTVSSLVSFILTVVLEFQAIIALLLIWGGIFLCIVNVLFIFNGRGNRILIDTISWQEITFLTNVVVRLWYIAKISWKGIRASAYIAHAFYTISFFSWLQWSVRFWTTDMFWLVKNFDRLI